MAALEQHTGAVLAQTAVERKSSKIAAVSVVLDRLDITDAVVTAEQSPDLWNRPCPS